jgi:hypothetical protein
MNYLYSLLQVSGQLVSHPVFKPKLNNVHSICAQELSFHTYPTKNGYIITNATIYNNYYMNNVFNTRLNRTLSNTTMK